MWRFPNGRRGRAVNPLSLGAPAVPGRHVGLHAGLVDEDQLARVRPALKALPPLAAAPHVGPVALVRHRRRLLAGEAADSQEAPNRGEARRPPSQSRSPASVMAGQALIRSRIQARHPASFGARRVPIRLGPADPVSEYRRAHLITLDGATRNSFATLRRLSPACTFSTARIRKSFE